LTGNQRAEAEFRDRVDHVRAGVPRAVTLELVQPRVTLQPGIRERAAAFFLERAIGAAIGDLLHRYPEMPVAAGRAGVTRRDLRDARVVGIDSDMAQDDRLRSPSCDLRRSRTR